MSVVGQFLVAFLSLNDQVFELYIYLLQICYIVLGCLGCWCLVYLDVQTRVVLL